MCLQDREPLLFVLWAVRGARNQFRLEAWVQTSQRCRTCMNPERLGEIGWGQQGSTINERFKPRKHSISNSHFSVFLVVATLLLRSLISRLKCSCHMLTPSIHELWTGYHQASCKWNYPAGLVCVWLPFLSTMPEMHSCSCMCTGGLFSDLSR